MDVQRHCGTGMWRECKEGIGRIDQPWSLYFGHVPGANGNCALCWVGEAGSGRCTYTVLSSPRTATGPGQMMIPPLLLSLLPACRLRATLQRLQRLTEGYSQVLMDAYAERARKLGAALGLDPYLINSKYSAGCAFGQRTGAGATGNGCVPWGQTQWGTSWWS